MTPIASGEPFRCVPTDDWCPEMPSIPSFAGVLNVSEGRRLGSVAWLACNQGYIYESGDSSVVCGSNASAKGEWLSPFGGPQIPLRCSKDPEHCSSDLSIDNRSVAVNLSSPGEYSFDATVHLSCAPGFQSVYGDASMRCSQRGFWVRNDTNSEVVTQPLRCAKVQNWCAEPRLAPGQRFVVHGGRLSLGDSITIRCEEGYEDAGGQSSQTLECGVDRLWRDVVSGNHAISFLECYPVAAFCPAVTVTRGTATLSRPANFSETISLSCDVGSQGYHGWPSTVCGSGGAYRLPVTNQIVWDPVGSSPEHLACAAEERFCSPLSSAGSRVISYTDTVRLGSQAHLACLPGFVQLGGSSVASCTSNGSWSNVSLSCGTTASWCPPLNVSSNANVTYSNNTLSLG
ncbi:Complement receptor, partial [Perkinsus olseni]